jgi:hypothetical protein
MIKLLNHNHFLPDPCGRADSSQFAQLDQNAPGCLRIKERDPAVGSRPGASLDNSGPVPLKIPDGCIQVIDLEAEVIDGPFLAPHYAGHEVVASVRLRVMQDLDRRVPDRKEAYLEIDFLIFFDFGTGEAEAGELLNRLVEILDHDPDMTQLL